MLLRRIVASICPVWLVLASAGTACSQEYPAKPIRIVAGSPGGGSDLVARMIAQGISGSLGQPLTVENRSGIVQTETAARALPDGHTLLVQSGALWILPLMRETSYDSVRDLAPITLIERSVEVVIVHPSLPVKSVKDLISLARAKPGEINYAASGPGSTSHLAAELFKSMAGARIVHVPYKGSGPALNALIGGEIQMMVASAPSVSPHLKSGRLRALAITSAEPSVLAPGLPTVAASGLPGYAIVGVSGMSAPAKTPAAIIKLLNDVVVRFLRMPETREKFLSAGSEVVGNSPDEFGTYIKSEIVKLGKVIKEAGIRAD
jgi:tripartite-type tricarboxylate transporter receptor subunit TctC